MSGPALHTWPALAQLAEDVRSGSVSAVSLVEKSQQLIEEAKDYNAIISISESRAHKRAQEIDAQIANGEDPGRLAGVPFIAKDNYLTFDTETTAASNILKGFKAPYQATVIERLEAEGAIMVAKANLDAFAHGASTENSDYGVTKNPHDPERVPGGSSGGSAAAMALGLAPFTIGSDTGGSIRQPASFTGTVGFKPTYGSQSRYGIVSMASSTDVPGPITRTVEDCALVYDIMAAQDSRDSTTIERYDDDFSALDEPKTLKIGLITEHMDEGVDERVRALVNETVQQLKDAGHAVEQVSIPELAYALPCYYIIQPAEVASNLARYDGTRFGHSASDPQSLDDLYERTRAEGFSSEGKRRIMIGNYVLSSGYYDAYYRKAQKVRTLLIDGFNTAFDNYDLIIGPTTPGVAFKIGQNTSDPVKMYLEDVMTVGMSLAGLPALSVPIAQDGLPVGLQITGPQKSDKLVLQLANVVEGLR